MAATALTMTTAGVCSSSCPLTVALIKKLFGRLRASSLPFDHAGTAVSAAEV
jgi:hypothetical protein